MGMKFPPLPDDWWGRRIFVRAGGLGAGEQAKARNGRGFTEGDQEALFNSAHDANTGGRHGLGRCGANVALKVGKELRWTGTKVVFEELEGDEAAAEENPVPKKAKSKDKAAKTAAKEAKRAKKAAVAAKLAQQRAQRERDFREAIEASKKYVDKFDAAPARGSGGAKRDSKAPGKAGAKAEKAEAKAAKRASKAEAKAAKRAAKAAAKAEAAAAKHAAKAAERAASSGKELKTKLPSKHDAGALAVQALAEGGRGVGLSPEALATAVLRKALGKNKSRRYDAKAVGLALVKKLTKSKKGKRASTGGSSVSLQDGKLRLVEASG